MSLENSFLIINLGSEMIYVIHQRLKAQLIAEDKAAQVIRDITTALLEQSFFKYLTTTFTVDLMTKSQARILMSDVSCCSLMRLDRTSLEKLLDLMVMVFKWQLFLISSPDDLLALTLKHLDGVGNIMPELQKMILIDFAKQYFVDQWNICDDEKIKMVNKLNQWFRPFSTKISLLIRMRLQNADGSFVDKISAETNEFFRYYSKNNGENIYEKIAFYSNKSAPSTTSSSKNYRTSFELDQLLIQLNIEGVLPPRSSYSVLQEEEKELPEPQSENKEKPDSTMSNMLSELNLQGFETDGDETTDDFDITNELLKLMLKNE